MAGTDNSIEAPLASGLAPAEAQIPDPIAPVSKIAQVISLLQRSGGATLTELVATTGWLPHTTRAALTGLRKKGYTLDKESRDGDTAYSIAKAA
jgi:hypothetical protein